MNSCFRGIINDGGRSGNGISLRSNTKALLLLCLACMVHHAGAFHEEVKKYSGHVLASITILPNGILCGKLKKFLTSEPSERIRMATWTPPHVEAVGMIQNLTSLIKQEREDRLAHYEQIKTVIANNIEEAAEENWVITRPLVMKMFDEFGAKFETYILSKIDTILQTVQNSNVNNMDIGLRRSGQDEIMISYSRV